MSAKSKQPAKKLSVPREMPEITREYQEQCFTAGQLQYEIQVKSDALNKVNERLLQINNEAAARNQLNAAKPAPEAVKGPKPGEEAKNESV